MHIWPNGDAFPCCMSDSQEVFGNVHEEPIDFLINNDKFKELRRQMLNGEKPKACSRCYELEDTADSWTLRKNSLESFKKHIPIGRGGIILTDNLDRYDQLQKLVRDGRDRKILWENDDVDTVGYHYYMTPEDAARGIMLFDQLHNVASTKTWSWQDYKPLNQLSVFKKQ